MAINVWVSSITFSDGTKIELSEGDIVLFVGPNNAGKSVALREILTQLGSKPVGSGVVVVEIEIGQSGDFSELIAFIEQNMRKTESGNDPSYAGWGTFVRLSQANGDWHTAGTRGLQSVTQLLVQHVSVDGRLHVSNPPAPIAFAREPLSHPVHFLYRHEDIEAKFSRYFHQAFGQDLIVNRGAGSQIPLHCGSDPEKLPGEDRVSARYLQELEMVPHLSEQGDGMRSFVGVLLQSLVGEHSIVLIDEPEAFLHPPQALLLGRMLVTERPKGRQLLLATHSIDFMKGVIDASSENVRVIRLRRDGLLNRVRELDKRGIKELWSDPILRHSDVLDGLFHTKVVICEGDADCRFYSAIMDAQYGSGEQIVPDVMFTHCGGKGRIPTIVKALRSLDVQTIVVCDFDVLREEHPLKAMCEALGANWKADVEGDWRTVKRAVESKKSKLASSEVASQIRTILNEVSQVSEVSESHFPQSAVDQIQKVLRSSSPWSIVKSTGKGYLPSGEASQAYGRLIKKLHLVGLFIVEVGELERFDTSIGGHGPRWVTSVLGKNLGEAPELAEARDFVSKLLKANPHYMG